MLPMERDLHCPRLLCRAGTQNDVGDTTSFEMLVALAWVVWHPFPKKNKRAAVVKITREIEDITVAPKVLSRVMLRMYIKASATPQMTLLAFVNRGVVELAHCKDESN